LYPSLYQLLAEGLALVLGAHEDVQALFLKLLGYFGRHFRRRSGTHHCGEAGRSPINELHPSFPQDDIISCTQPNIALGRLFLLGIKVWKFQVSNGLHYLLRK